MKNIKNVEQKCILKIIISDEEALFENGQFMKLVENTYVCNNNY